MEIEGRTAIITGGASGLGAAAAKELASRGAKVALLDQERARELGEEFASSIGNAAVFAPADVTDEVAVDAAIELANERFGSIDICVNCAGIGVAGRTLDREGEPFSISLFRKAIDVNLVGSFNVLRLAAKRMATNKPNGEKERGVIINTASGAAFEGQIGQAAYSASKAGLVGMTLPVARDLAVRGIRVCTIAPGMFATPMMLGAPEQVLEQLAATVPFPDRLGKPPEFGHMVASIVENPMMNGETVRLDGALRMAPK